MEVGFGARDRADAVDLVPTVQRLGVAFRDAGRLRDLIA